MPADLKAGPTETGRTQGAKRDKKLEKSCADFEAMLVAQVLKTMRKTIPKNGLLKSSQGRETYEMILDQKIAEDLANKGEGLGLKEMLYRQMTRQPSRKD